MQPKGPRLGKTALAISDEDLRRVAGIYKNRDNRRDYAGATLKRPNSIKAPMVKRSEGRYAAEGMPGEFVVAAGPSGKTEYLNQGSRSLARMK